MVYKDLADRCIINPTIIEKGDHRVFYIKPETVFTKEPRIQNQFRNDFIKSIQSPPVPEPLTLMADEFLKKMLDDVSDQSAPIYIRNKMNRFFQRRQYKLQHKKHKYLSRWSHFALTSELVDKVSVRFAPNFSKIQFELEQSIKRHQRLDGNDHFDNEPRPQRIEPNGLINPEDVDCETKNLKYCSLRVDDIDIYTRIVGYESACNRNIDKFVNRAKWVPLSHRFDIYEQAQERFQQDKSKNIKEQKNWQERLETKGKELIELKQRQELGSKELQQIKNQLRIVQNEKKIRGIKDSLISSKSYEYQMPPLILSNQIELKLTLEDLCVGFINGGDMEIDDGNSFGYAVAIKFSKFFFDQMIKCQFALYDAVPQLLNPVEIGRRDFSEVMKENLLKYGKNPAGSTLVEKMEIQAQSERLNIQFLNNIEKSLFGEFNNGQTDFPKVRLKKCHWLPYVCFKAQLSTEQMQQAALLAKERNPVDQVQSQVMDLMNLNDISSVNQVLETLSQIHQDKVISGKVRKELNILDYQTVDSIFSEQERMFLKIFRDSIKVKTDFVQKENFDIPRHSLYETSQHLLFAQYMMVTLKSREHKIRLLYTLNGFRSVQKRIALELRELATRDRVSFDITQVDPKENWQKSSLFSEEALLKEPSKTGNVKKTAVNLNNDEMIDINCYRFKGLTQNQMWSTCPVLPKFHSTFGEPIERQEVSTEFEVNQDPKKDQAQRLLGRIDFLKEYQNLILVQDDYGVNVMYDCTFEDMRALEQEMLRILSFYINKIEPVIDLDFQNIIPIVDRFNFMKDLLVCEDQYQRAKLDLVFCYLECYEHTCDTLEQQQLIQIIVDLMAKRPRLNLQANHFADCYKAECQLLLTQKKIIKEFIQMQMDNELEKNKDVRESLEKTYRLIYEQIDNKWQYFEQGDVKDEMEKRKLNALGVKNDSDILKMKQLEKAKPGMFQAKQPTVSVHQFAEMLGMPTSSLQMLLKEHHERDPQVKSSVHEDASFIKLQEGYPILFSDTEIMKQNKSQLVPGGQSIGILEIYESLSQIVKLAVACNHCYKEIHEVHQPDNGQISTLLELITTEFLLAELRAVKTEMRGDQGMQARDLQVIEDSSILGNPEKTLFFIKELVAAAQDPDLIQNPFVLTKIDMQTIEQYDFDAVQGKQFKKREQKQKSQQPVINQNNDKGETQEQIALESIIEGNEAISSEEVEENEDVDDFTKKQRLHEKMKDKAYPRLKIKYVRPNIPAMLELICNSVEVLRLRHLLVSAYNQRQILNQVYNSQCKTLHKESKVNFSDPFSFDTHINGGQDWKNFIDEGPGMETFVNTTLSIKEFDPSLTSVINFSDPEAFKALVCPLGLEELRVVVRYEILNLHLLVVGARHNQILLDNLQRQLAEISLFEKGFLVSAPAWDIVKQLQSSNLQYDSNVQRISVEEKRKVQKKLDNKVSRISYGIISKKMRPKDQVQDAYKKIRQSVVEKKFDKVEISLRYLRSSRIMLCHDYCTDVYSQVYLDILRIELLQEVNQIRRRAYLLPRDAMIHKVPFSKNGEHSLAAYNEELYRKEEDENSTTFYEKGKITKFFQLPDFEEICLIQQDREDFAQNIKILYKYDFGESDQTRPNIFDLDQKKLLKSLIPTISDLDLQSSEQQIKLKGRYVDYKEAPVIQDQLLFKYLYYFRNFQNLFDLEFFKCKLSVSATSICTLEQSVMSGRQFWDDHQELEIIKEEENDIPYDMQPDDIKFRNHLAELVLTKMGEEKKLKIKLITELDQIKEAFQKVNSRMQKLTLYTDIKQAAEFLQDLVQLNFNSIMLSLITVREMQSKNGTAQKEIQQINEIMSLFSHTDDAKITYLNGFHVNHANTRVDKISLEYNQYNPDYFNFFLATQPVMDETYLNPTEFNLVRGIYTSNSMQLRGNRQLQPFLGSIQQRDFHYLDMQLLNLSRELRRVIWANQREIDETSLKYAHVKLRFDNEQQYQYNQQAFQSVIKEQKQFQKHQIQSNRLKYAIIILMTKRMLPTESEKLKLIHEQFYDLTGFKIMAKFDEIERFRKNSYKPHKTTLVQDIQADIARQSQVVTHPILSQYDQISCQIDVYQREIQNYMILTAKRIVERETTSLANAFEINGKRLEVLIDVHQQFAATFDEHDKLSHLDIVQKVSSVQKMLTQMKNRMLSYKQLTGGEGVMIRTKDLLQILEDFTRNIVKEGEQQMRTRCDTLITQLTTYEHLLYSKDQQICMLEHKLKYAAQELNRILSVKVFSKGNQIVYELDHTMRQLRLVKDNVFEMEEKLKEKVRLSFDKELQRARLHLEEMKRKFTEYQQTLNSNMKADITKNLNELDVELKKLVQSDYKSSNKKEKSKEQLFDDYGHLIKGDLKNEHNLQVSSESKDLEQVFREMERLKASEKQAREEVLSMQHLMRKQRMIQNFKWMNQHRKWDEKIENLRQQQNSNATLWEQLAESEKRERILKSELQRTQQEVATLDKVLERLKDELKVERTEKQKLLAFKGENVKRTIQLENMTKQMEVVANIDLDKIIAQVSSKEKQLEVLKSETKDSSEVIAQIFKTQQKQLQETRKRAKLESIVKDAALQKVKQMKAEIELLQSGDMSSLNLWKDKAMKLREQKSDALSQYSSVHSNYLLTQPKQYPGVKSHHMESQKHLPTLSSNKKPKLPSLTINRQSQAVSVKQIPKKGNIFEDLAQDSLIYNQLFDDQFRSHSVMAENPSEIQIGVKKSSDSHVGSSRLF